MSKLENNKKKKKNSLLDTAFDLFITQGINKTSISDIVDKAGVAKGTFYLYFKDKYDIRNKLISHKSSQLFQRAYDALNQTVISDFNGRLLFIVNYIIDELTEDKMLLNFITKNLSWGIFKEALITPAEEQQDLNILELFYGLIGQSGLCFREPEIMLFLIVEIVSSTCYSSILYNEPAPIEKVKPYIYETIDSIIKNHMLPCLVPEK